VAGPFWVPAEALVAGNAQVRDEALVGGRAQVRGETVVGGNTELTSGQIQNLGDAPATTAETRFPEKAKVGNGGDPFDSFQNRVVQTHARSEKGVIER
jgi:hypothetical protein